MVSRRNSSHDSELSIPRVNRLLRPLRNKCAILASKSAGPTTITYRSTSSKPSLAPPDLVLLNSPSLVVSPRFWDDGARQIYAIAKAYENVVQATHPSLDECQRGILSLTDMCAVTVGRNLQAEVAAEGGETDDVAEMDLAGALYESVPAQCRRCDGSS